MRNPPGSPSRRVCRRLTAALEGAAWSDLVDGTPQTGHAQRRTTANGRRRGLVYRGTRARGCANPSHGPPTWKRDFSMHTVATRRSLLVAVLCALALLPSPASRRRGRAAVGAGRHRHGRAGRADLHRWGAVHGQLHLHRRHRHVHRSGRALLQPAWQHRGQRLHRPLAAAGHAGGDRRRVPAGNDGLQLVAGDAGGERADRDGLPQQRLRPDPHRPGRPRQGQPLDAPLGRPDRAEHAGHRSFEDIYSYGTPRCASACSRHRRRRATAWAATPSAGPTRCTPSRRAPPVGSGSGFLDADGNAFGVLSTLSAAPFPASNNASDLASCLQYMRTHGGPAAALEPGTEPFTPSLLPV